MGLTILKTPRAGFEPATNRLTADRSTAELPRKAPKELTPDYPPIASQVNLPTIFSPEIHCPNLPSLIIAAPSQYVSSSRR